MTEPAMAARIAIDSSGRHRGLRVTAMLKVTYGQCFRVRMETEETQTILGAR